MSPPQAIKKSLASQISKSVQDSDPKTATVEPCHPRGMCQRSGPLANCNKHDAMHALSCESLIPYIVGKVGILSQNLCDDTTPHWISSSLHGDVGGKIQKTYL